MHIWESGHTEEFWTAACGPWSAVLGAALLLLAGCDLAGSATRDFEPRYVVESYQVAGGPLAPVRLSRTSPLDSTYDPEELAVPNAQVWVELLDSDGGVEARYTYAEVENEPGLYQALLGTRVIPLRTYRLVVMVSEGAGKTRLSATTTVPDRFHIVHTWGDTVVYQARPLNLTVTKGRTPTRPQSHYILTGESLLDEPTQEDLTSFYRSVIDESGGTLDLEDFVTTTSPILNAAGFSENPDGTFTVEVPWFLVAFYGPNRLTITALDDNLYDFYRSQRMQQGGSTLAPGEIPNVLEHVEGGTGVFGSLARRSHYFFVHPPAPEAGLRTRQNAMAFPFECAYSVAGAGPIGQEAAGEYRKRGVFESGTARAVPGLPAAGDEQHYPSPSSTASGPCDSSL